MAAGYPAGPAANGCSARGGRGEHQDRRRRVVDRRLRGDVVGPPVLVDEVAVEGAERPARLEPLLLHLIARRRAAYHRAVRQTAMGREDRRPVMRVLGVVGAEAGDEAGPPGIAAEQVVARPGGDPEAAAEV